MNSQVDGRRPLRLVIVPVAFVAVVAVIVVGVSLHFKPSAPQYYGWWPWAPFGWFLFVPLFFVAFFALRFLWWGGWDSDWYGGEDSAMQVIKERFARGELTTEQFEQMRKDLS